MKNLYDLISAVGEEQKSIELDFQNPAHRELFIAMGGKEEDIKKAVNCSVQPENDDEYAFQEGICISYAIYFADEERLCLQGVTSLKDQVSKLTENLLICDSNTGEEIASRYNKSTDTHHSFLNCTQPYSLPVNKSIKRISATYFVSTYDTETDRVRSFLFYQSLDQAFSRAQNVVFHINVTDPVFKTKYGQQCIRVCYDRELPDGQSPDYDYRNLFEQQNPRIYLDVSASVDLMPDCLPFDGIDISKLSVQLDCQRGFANYCINGRQPEIINAFQQTEDGFEFHLKTDWQRVFRTPSLPLEEPVDFLFKCHFYCRNKSREGYFLFGSNINRCMEGFNAAIIPQLQLI